MTDNLTVHEAGTLALRGVAKAALAALRVAVDDLASKHSDPKAATRAVSEQATLLSKAVDSLAKKIDDLPKAHRVPDAPATAGPSVELPDVQEALTRLRSAASGLVCAFCGGTLPGTP